MDRLTHIVSSPRLTRRGWPDVLFFLVLAAALYGPGPATHAAVGGADSLVTADTLTLDRALAFALAHHPELDVARAAVAVAATESIAARARPFNPELEFRFAKSGDSFAGGDRSIEVGVSQELELGGKRQERRRVAEAHLLTAESELDARRQEITSDVRARFQQALFQEYKVGFLERVLDLDRRIVGSTHARVEDGTVTPLTGRLTDLDFLEVESRTELARSESRQAFIALGRAMGSALPESLRLAGVLTADTLTTPPAALGDAALRSRVEARVLQRRIDERRAELELARREAWPNITLGLGVNFERQVFAADEFSGDPAVTRGIAGAVSRDRLLQLSVRVPVPLVQRNQGGRARSEAELDRASRELGSFAFQLRADVDAADTRFRDAARLYRLYLSSTARAEDDLALVREAYADGRINLESYLTQKSRLVSALTGVYDAGDRYWEARAALESALGAGLGDLMNGETR